MPLFSRETKRLRQMRNELESEVTGLRSKERHLDALLRRVALTKADLEATKEETDGDPY